jgi:hypothetical protein
MNLCWEKLRQTIGAALLILLAATSGAADRDNPDKGKDGKPPLANMSPEERREVREMRREKMRERFERADQDGDRALSREEAGRVGPRVQDNFDNVDTNKDGKASEEEIRAFRRERAKLRRIERGGADPRF